MRSIDELSSTIIKALDVNDVTTLRRNSAEIHKIRIDSGWMNTSNQKCELLAFNSDIDAVFDTQSCTWITEHSSVISYIIDVKVPYIMHQEILSYIIDKGNPEFDNFFLQLDMRAL